MIWATTAEVRDYLSDDDILPADYDEATLQRDIDKAVRKMATQILRWPCLNEDDRPDDEKVRKDVIAAVAELIKYRREQAAAAEALGGAGTAEILKAGGSISAGKTSVSGGKGAKVGRYADTLPCDTVEALEAAGMIGGSVPTW
ncbi:hypothetical protein JOF56_011611 [Kibdelosporangium banguiense]|uniref:Head-to-tail adaptor n=1 Tax=Kibdelosporangium banguiense TaxID=1365924 RepID=A0ABS4U4U9_9PSEU|nr:hypothetical protein [Kibdelosporangium banguiense]MBP2331226.1 hypothetical protein [Kibdelosporangium banguiense]